MGPCLDNSARREMAEAGAASKLCEFANAALCRRRHSTISRVTTADAAAPGKTC
jgi:hypothetical protein